MKDRRKTLVLYAGREGGKWDVRLRVKPDATLQFSSFWIEGRDSKIRDRDLHYFRCHIPEFLKGKEIHHEWNNGAICYILEKEVHHAYHKSH